MSEEWDFYFCQVDDKPASIFVDLGIREQTPMATLPNRAYLSISMRQPRPDGLSSQDEYDALRALEDAVSTRLNSSSAIYVGRNTCGGLRDFWFYVANAEQWSPLVEKFMADFPEYKFVADAEPDPRWDAYLEFLYPNEQGWDFITNRRVCDQLEKGGDPLTEIRDVEHWAYFPDTTTREAFIARIEPLGFDVRERYEQDESTAEYGVRFGRQDIPSHNGIHDITVPLLRAARQAGGRYDGWETQQLAPDAAH